MAGLLRAPVVAWDPEPHVRLDVVVDLVEDVEAEAAEVAVVSTFVTPLIHYIEQADPEFSI